MRKQTGYYAVIPSNILFDENLTDSEKLLYAHISTMINMNGSCELSNAYFEKSMKASKRTIYRWLDSLEKHGYLERKLKYKKGTKIVDKRVITMVSQMTLPGDTDDTTPGDTNGTVINNPTGSLINIEENFNFLLSKKQTIDKTTENYKVNLIDKIEKFIKALETKAIKLGVDMPNYIDAEDFLMILESKGYTYKNFWLAYQTWHRNGVKK